nr:hypothetical protein [Nocardia pseudovaccinii]
MADLRAGFAGVVLETAMLAGVVVDGDVDAFGQHPVQPSPVAALGRGRAGAGGVSGCGAEAFGRGQHRDRVAGQTQQAVAVGNDDLPVVERGP